MPDREKVIKGLECCQLDVNKCLDCPYLDKQNKVAECGVELHRDAIALLKAQEPITGETSDGYHMFNELYHHRAVLFSVIVSVFHDRAWKSKKHHDGTMFDGMFIVGIDTPDGQATYHYDVDPYWDMFDCKVREFAPEWDGHTPAQAIERIGKLKAQEPKVLDIHELHKWVMTARVIKEPIWLEVKDGFGCWIVNEHCGDLPDCELIDKTYGIMWRCWTSRPTDEQREAEVWND